MKPLKNIKIFESLNCILCKQPFGPIARQPRSPRFLACGLAMCHECFEKEKSLIEEKREHQCNFREECFYNPNFAYCVIDMLSQDCFTLSPLLGGYLLKKPSIDSECPIDECNHIVCTEWLQGLWNEMAEMTRQLEEMKESGYRFCDECNKLDIVDEMHHCQKCLLQLCGNCIYKNHRSHRAITLLRKEAGQLSNELCDLSVKEVQTFNQLFSQLHKELSDGLEGFDQKRLEKERDLRNVLTFENLTKKLKECKGLKTEFETCSEEYMSHLRKYYERVKELMGTPDGDSN